MRVGVWEDRPFGDLARDEPEQMAAFNNGCIDHEDADGVAESVYSGSYDSEENDAPDEAPEEDEE